MVSTSRSYKSRDEAERARKRRRDAGFVVSRGSYQTQSTPSRWWFAIEGKQRKRR